MNIDLNLDNYDLDDILNLFKISYDFNLDELKKDGFCDYIQPSGGYFISFESSNSNAEQIIEQCSKLGLKLLPIGSCFPYQKDPKNSNIRIAPTFPNLENLEKCMEIFSKVVKKLN